MQSTSAASFQSYWYPIPNPFLLQSRINKRPSFLYLHKNQNRTKNFCFVTLPTTNNCGKERENFQPNKTYLGQSIEQFPSSSRSINLNEEEKGHPQHKESGAKNCELLSTNMWWTDLKAALGQRINVEGIVSSTMVILRDRQLALPHVYVPDIRYIDWAELQRRGFKGVVFDKDNTITVPYSLTLWGPLSNSIEQCKSVFGHDIAVFSNSAGLNEYDHNSSRAKTLEGTIGIKVIRHRVKKPAGTAEEIEKHFGCESSQLIMVGDRPFTDIVYGNRNGFLTILTEPLSLAGEPFIVRQVRKLEVALVKRWYRRGLKPVRHDLLPDAIECVKDPSPP